MKKLFCLSLVLLCFALVACVESGDVSEHAQGGATMTSEQNYVNGIDMERENERAMSAWSILAGAKDSHFAGGWIEHGNLHILLTTAEAEVEERYRDVLRNYNDILVFDFIEGGRSFDELASIRDEVFRVFSESDDFVIAAGSVIERENKIELEFEGFDESMRNDIEYFLTDAIAENEHLNGRSIDIDLFILTEGVILVGDGVGSTS